MNWKCSRRRSSIAPALPKLSSQAVLSNLSSGVLVFGMNGLVKSSNSAAKEILGFASTTGMGAEDIFRGAVVTSGKLAEPDASASDQEFSDGPVGLADEVAVVLREGSKRRRAEAEYETPAGEKRFLALTVSPIPAEDGGLLGVACLISDLTEREQTRRQQELQGEISAEMALQLRSSLTTISGYAQHLANNRDPELAKQLAADIAHEAADLDRRIGGFLTEKRAAQSAAAFGFAEDARRSAARALEIAPTSAGATAEAALAFAMAGDAAKAEALAKSLDERYPLDTQMQSLWLPAIRAQLALQRNDSSGAIALLQAALPLEFANINFLNNLSCLYPTYLRGEAFLAAGQGSAAATEFQKIIDHSGMVWNCWTGALAHLGIARANALQSKTSQGADADAARARALAAYKDFLGTVERRRPRYPHLQTSQKRIREVAVDSGQPQRQLPSC